MAKKAPSNRALRVGDTLQRALSVLIQREVSDPRVKLASVSAVKMSQDLSYAKVYISVLGDEKQAVDAVNALTKAKGYLRTLLAKSMTSRVVPELKFILDTTVLAARKMSDLIDQAIESDKKDHG